MKAYDSVTLVL